MVSKMRMPTPLCPAGHLPHKGGAYPTTLMGGTA
ncbi:hypothetical protein FHT82_005421 [Rhizobium sp. BK275]|nr:hypothetical protein [Rhizobium sp. BK275]